MHVDVRRAMCISFCTKQEINFFDTGTLFLDPHPIYSKQVYH